MSRAGRPLKYVDVDGVRLETNAQVEVVTPVTVYMVWESTIDPTVVWVSDFYGNTYIVQSKHRPESEFRVSKEE